MNYLRRVMPSLTALQFFDAAVRHMSFTRAAADLLLREAGGLLTDFAGQPLRYNRPDVAHPALIAAGPPRHATLVDLVRDRRSEFA